MKDGMALKKMGHLIPQTTIYTVEIRSGYDATKESYRGSIPLVR
ncbi:MAG: hypothetical protein ACJAY8_000372 [Sphingobacteriales bacterium]|jgi:hypothetical protein